MATYWVNDDGLRVRFGPYPAVGTDPRATESTTFGATRQHTVVWTYDNLPDMEQVAANNDTGVNVIPAGSVIKDAWLTVETAFAGGTSYDIGLDGVDGTAEDADGLWDALVLADINAVDETRLMSAHGGTNSGALQNAPLSQDCVLLVTATGTFTAGKAKLTIEFVGPAVN